jgi:two-component system C4-dicarboxylate transport sensor histidine kinase DctB
MALFGVVASGIGGFLAAEGLGRTELQRTSEARIGLYASTLDQVVDRFRTLPFVLARDERILGLLEQPTEAEAVGRANQFLADLSTESGGAVLYVMNTAGLTLASSNHDQPQSFVGQNYAFRPYFSDAVTRGTGQFFAIGVTTGEPGYFLSRAIRRGAHLLGVAVVKISLDQLEAEWRTAGEAIALTDSRGIVFLSSMPRWKYQPLRTLTAEERTDIARVMQYSNINLSGPPLLRRMNAPANGQIVSIATTGRDTSYLVARRDLPGYDWTLYAFADIAPLQQTAIVTGLATALAFVAALLLALWWMGRRAVIRAKLEAHDVLERRVTERTRALVSANESLAREVDERRRAETALKDAQDELIQAGKLAALGQMSAALVHEINQPLAALRTTLASTKFLLRNGAVAKARETVTTMDDLVGRMAELTQHLKTFARKNRGEMEKVDIAIVVQRSLALAGPRLAAEKIRTVVDMPAGGALALGNATRLEQVLLNLIGNAADALSTSPTIPRTIHITVTEHSERIHVTVADSGPGIPARHLASIFDPFFTTKEADKGLGLGLSLSYAIIEGHGGHLRAANRTEGGAEFTFDLPAAAAVHSPRSEMSGVLS